MISLMVCRQPRFGGTCFRSDFVMGVAGAKKAVFARAALLVCACYALHYCNQV